MCFAVKASLLIHTCSADVDEDSSHIRQSRSNVCYEYIYVV